MIRTNLTLGALTVLSVAPYAGAQWVNLVNETTTRVPLGPGLNTAALSTSDPEEKDYAWGDVDQDGDIDLVCVRKQPFTSTGRRPNVLFMNEGIAEGHAINGVLVDRTAQYASAADVAGDLGFLTATNDRDVVLIDVNNDTWLDIVTAPTLSDGQPKHIGHPRIYINLGESNGNWLGFRFENNRIPNMSPLSFPNVHPRFCSVAAGDVTGDGYADLYFGDYDSGGSEPYDFNNKLLINQGALNPGYFLDSGTARMSANPGLLSAFGAASAMGDLNNDGAMDVLKQTSLSSPTHVAVQHNNAANVGFFPDLGYKTVSSESPYFASLGDLNNDGRLDIIVTSDGIDHYLLNTGNGANGSANFATYYFPGSSGFGSQSIAADLNNDGWKDVMIADVDVDIPGCSRRTFIYRNLGNAPNVTFQEQTPSVIPTSMLVGTHNIAVFDLNGDSRLDVIMGRCSSMEVWINVPPAGIAYTYPSGLPGYLTPNQTTTFNVQLNAVSGGTIDGASAKIFTSQNGGPFVQSSLVPLGGNLYSATLPPTACPDQVNFYFSAQLTTGQTFFDPPTGAADPYLAVAALGTQVTMNNEIEGDVSDWTIVNDASLTGGAWEQAIPNGTINAGAYAAPYEDATGGAENLRAFVTENGPVGNTSPGSWDVDGGPTSLISPTIDLAGNDATILFSAWFYASVEGDVLNVAVSNDNGANWTSVMNLTTTTVSGNTSWVNKSFVVGDHVSPTAAIRVKFSTVDVGTPSVVEAGIDNFRVEEIMCSAVQPCPPDVNNSGGVDINDLLAVIGSWGPCPAPCPPDIDDSGAVDINDMLAVIGAWGPCP